MPSITLEYKRVGHSYKGRILHDAIPCLDIEDASFKELMVAVCSKMKADTSARVFLKRVERPGLRPVEIAGAEYEELLSDPEAFADARSTEHRVVHTRDGVSVADTVKLTVRAGVDTLADAFGGVVYCRMRRGGGVECPCCGRWGVARSDRNMNGFFRCKACSAEIIGKAYPTKDGGWWGIDIRVLLQDTTSKMFYLPRAWNTSGPWISREDLERKYEQYLKEKDNAVDR